MKAEFSYLALPLACFCITFLLLRNSKIQFRTSMCWRSARPDKASSSQVETEFSLLISSLGSEISNLEKL
jgi:hypothetical protein